MEIQSRLNILMLLLFLGLWFTGFSGACLKHEWNPRKVFIPVWLSRILFLKKLESVPLEFLIFQAWTYVFSVSSLIAYIFDFVGKEIYALYLKISLATIAFWGIYGVFNLVIYAVKKKKNLSIV
ncbi:hypothetical protein [Desulfofundulus australicus]|uniref:hypothetical protein n=1 Tax=Desulfofundulus australicus TaxID=1566 RepID=UPI0009343E21|nr:hypothetical protein [Desulfofundulus australicus]